MKVEVYLMNNHCGFRKQKGTREAILGLVYLSPNRLKGIKSHT